MHDDYKVTATYNGGTNYDGKTADDLFNVTKAESTVIVIPTDIEYGQTEPMVINITVTNASGKVNITIFKKGSQGSPDTEIDSWIESVLSGETSITYDNKVLDAGNYTVTL